MHASTGLVSLTRAAELLTEAGDRIDRTSLSRYVKQHADALNPTRQGRETVVDLDTLRRHRKENIRLADAKPFAGSRSRADEAAGKIRADRQLRELDLAERQQAVTPVAEVKEAAFMAVGALRSTFALAVNDTAETIAAVSGLEARLIRPHLRALERSALDAFVKVLADHGMPTDPVGDALGDTPGGTDA